MQVMKCDLKIHGLMGFVCVNIVDVVRLHTAVLWARLPGPESLVFIWLLAWLKWARLPKFGDMQLQVFHHLLFWARLPRVGTLTRYGVFLGVHA